MIFDKGYLFLVVGKKKCNLYSCKAFPKQSLVINAVDCSILSEMAFCTL